MHYKYISSSLYYAYFSMDSMPLDPHITDNLGEEFLKPGYIYCPLCTHLTKNDTNINTLVLNEYRENFIYESDGTVV